MAKKKKIKKKTLKRKAKKRLKIDFISMKNVEGSSVDEKIENILETVKDGHIVVFNEALRADEEAKLVTATMEGIKGEFSGIEFCSLEQSGNVIQRIVTKFFEIITRRKFTKYGLTMVGPSNVIEEIKRDPDAFYVSAEV